MENLNEKMAHKCAEEYVKRKYNPFGGGMGFTCYYVCVGESKSSDTNNIYAEKLPALEVEIINNSMATDIFLNKKNIETEYLIRVGIDYKVSEMICKTLVRPSSK